MRTLSILTCFCVVYCSGCSKTESEQDIAQCVNNLRQIEAAKDQWVYDTKASPGSVPAKKDIDKWLKGGFDSYKCGKGGTYSINPVGRPPSCSLYSTNGPFKFHRLPEG